MIGQGLVAGRPVTRNLAIRPGDKAYVDHTGAVYHPQDENNTDGNIAFYEITAEGDEIDLDLRRYISDATRPHVAFYPLWGATDFDIIERATDETLVSEQSGFDTNVYVVDISGSDGQLRLTNFDTGDGVDGTEAGWYAYLDVYDLVV